VRSSQPVTKTGNRHKESDSEIGTSSQTSSISRKIWPENYDNIKHMQERHAQQSSRHQRSPDNNSNSSHSIYIKSESSTADNNEDEISESPYEWMNFKDLPGKHYDWLY